MESTPVPLAAHGTYYRAAVCSDACAPCAPVRARQREKSSEKAKRVWDGRTIMAPHGTTTRAAICTDDCSECGAVRARRAEKERAYYNRHKVSVGRKRTAFSAPEPKPAPTAEYEGRDEYLAHLKELFE